MMNSLPASPPSCPCTWCTPICQHAPVWLVKPQRYFQGHDPVLVKTWSCMEILSISWQGFPRKEFPLQQSKRFTNKEKDHKNYRKQIRTFEPRMHQLEKQMNEREETIRVLKDRTNRVEDKIFEHFCVQIGVEIFRHQSQ
ncbi:structural maintenance of chromosomes protein 1A-like [Mya arenaria]|uniref:structural maintenance of chromosomes protein 1A-like n=1 Tax=Mya arenaria TaxID=6604 RepID=UPI0022E00D3C|nr:structural maintenance of chromosomes protein 1A-like [Mya arenaria]